MWSRGETCSRLRKLRDCSSKSCSVTAEQKKYLLHEFVVMPDHFHLILTPTGITLERSMGLVKGGFSFQLNKNLKAKREIWQPSFC